MDKTKEANKYLFICKANIRRSRTGERIFKQMLEQVGFRVGSLEDETKEGFDFIVDSAGLLEGHGKRKFETFMADEARYIFAADNLIVYYLENDYGLKEDKRIIDLGIFDEYDTSNPLEREQLERIFRSKLREYVPVI